MSQLLLTIIVLQVRVAEYNNVKGQLTAINRKQTGRCAGNLF